MPVAHRPGGGPRGFAILESLIAMLVLALALLALGRFMARQLADLRAIDGRAVALQHIDALGARLALAGATLQPLSAEDLPAAWIDSLRSALPGARFQVFRSAAVPQQVGIAIAWPADERPLDERDAARQQALLHPAWVGSGFDCPARHRCHVAYVHP